MPDLIITKLERDEFGVWTAHVSRAGNTIPVTRRYGSWGTIPEGGRWAQLLPDVAAALQKRVFPIENRERIEREKARKAA